jgi:hypothetical protein
MYSELIELQRELDNWKRVALYLADCHAATAECIADRKSASRSDKKRFASICIDAMNLLKNPAIRMTSFSRHSSFRSLSIDDESKCVIDRCRNGAERICESDKKGKAENSR